MNSSTAIYIHIPFCEVKCGYCDFFSVPRGWEEFDLQEEYIEALCREIDQRCRGESCIRPHSELILGDHKDRPYNIQSIFFGGGTPSLLRPDLLEKILTTLNQYFTWDAACEITMETNPKTIDLAGLKDRKALGINRISMGAQSFQDDYLKTLGRIHSAQEAIQTIQSAFQAGFENVSFDLIFALPGQSLKEWQQDLNTALDLGTSHLSCYNLTIEPETAFAKIYGNASTQARPPLPLPDEETALAMFWHTRNHLAQAGLQAYEISNFARPGFECLHNQNYWNYGAYLGFGVAAASFIKNSKGKSHSVRQNNPRNLQKYLQAEFSPDQDEISQAIAMGEFVMLALRKREGLSEEKFLNEFGINFRDIYQKQIDKFVGAQCIAPVEISVNGHDESRPYMNWQLTDRGLELADTVMSEFLA